MDHFIESVSWDDEGFNTQLIFTLCLIVKVLKNNCILLFLICCCLHGVLSLTLRVKVYSTLLFA